MDCHQATELSGTSVRQVEYLCDSLTSFKPRERSKARELLIAIGEPAIIPLIANLREHHTAFNPHAREILVEIGEPAVPSLALLLQARSHELREHAAIA